MATLVLGGLGSLIGGPIGGALGAMIGNQVDSALFGPGAREGARLTDLSITTSSYGTPIPRHFGTVRAAGSLIWATELQESSETSGGKGKPKVTSYSYSISFAVALSSRPIAGLGRIWADGNLLRGSAGDLKVGGTMRLYTGYGDQPVDPLIAAAQSSAGDGDACPAFRDCAYVVFEGLELTDFGNRIPALSFEIFAGDAPIALIDLIAAAAPTAQATGTLAGVSGWSDSGGRTSDMVAALGALYPVASDAGPGGLTLALVDGAGPAKALAASPVIAPDGEGFGAQSGQCATRDSVGQHAPTALRYYDAARDYQPGLQRAGGRAASGAQTTLEVPATLQADTARELIDRAANRARSRRETRKLRLAELDPQLGPGQLVTLPVSLADNRGIWLVESWHWLADGVELELARCDALPITPVLPDAGNLPLPRDAVPGATRLRAFELPWDGHGLPDQRKLYAAAASDSAQWAGAALYSTQSGRLDPLGGSGATQAVIGQLSAPLASSPAVLLERTAMATIELSAAHMVLEQTDESGLAEGRNRLLVGDEVIQFMDATQDSATGWTLRGLLRGRGGTEHAAQRGHAAGMEVVLLDHRLIDLSDAQALATPDAALAAIGRGDDDPVTAPLTNIGLHARPLSPVHAVVSATGNGDLALSWTRRARGTWAWSDGLETPINEQFERYRIGIGPVAAPLASWDTAEQHFTLPASTAQAHSGQLLWVCQIGNTALSHPLLLATL